MAGWNKWLFGGLGWALAGPIGGIIGFALGSVSEEAGASLKTEPKILPNDFSAALLVLCAAVMRADNRVMRSELDYVRVFFNRTFGENHTRERMLLFREILKQDIPIGTVCEQIGRHMDVSARLELMHLLFGLAASDGEIGKAELSVLGHISSLIGVNPRDMESIRAMFIKNVTSSYKILEVDPSASDAEIKKAYRKQAMKFHPDKVHHLGPEFQKDAQDKFRKINEAYEAIASERGMN